MFKNKIVFTQSYPLSKKERKEICATLRWKFDKDIIEYISTNLKTMTIQKGNIMNYKRNVIFNESNPILFEYDTNIYYPTVYLLQMCNFGIGRNIITKVALIHEATVEYIVNGADLMIKGVINRTAIQQSRFNINDLFYVQTDTGKPIGIGLSILAYEIMNTDNPSGKFLKIIHRIRDSLWSLGNQKEQPLLPIDSIIENEKEKRKEQMVIQSNQIMQLTDENNNQNEDNNRIEETEIDHSTKDENYINNSNQEENVKINDNRLESLIQESNDINEENDIKDEQKEDSKSSFNTNMNKEETDRNLDHVFLTLCKLHLEKEKFPIDPGKLLKDFMRPLSIQLNLNIDLKQSSYKKINNYLKYLQKEKSLVTFSKAKGQTNDYLQSINWNSPILKNFIPGIKKIKLGNEHPLNNQHDNILLSKDEKIVVTELYKPNQKIKPLFYLHIPNFDDKEYYSIKECTEVLTKYLHSKGLFVLTAQGVVHLDKTLEEMLSVHHTDFSFNEREYKIEDVIEMLKRNLNKKSCILKTSTTDENKIEEVFYSKEVSIRIVAKKIQNKNVTLIEGLERFIEINNVTKALAKQFATSVTIKDIQGMKNAIFIQGYWVNELVNILTEEFKLKRSLIKVEDRLKIKHKK